MMSMRAGRISFFENWIKFSIKASLFFFWVALFFLPFSHFIVNQAVFLSAFFVLVSGCYRQKWFRLKQYKFILWVLLFIVIVGISMTYSSATVSNAFTFFNKYTKLLYIIFFLHICENERARQNSLNIFLLGIIVATILAFLYQLHWINYSIDPGWQKLIPTPGTINGYFINPIPFSVLQAFAIYLLTVKFYKTHKLLCLIWLFLIVVNLFYFNGERTGCFAAIMLVILATVQTYLKQKKLLLKSSIIIFILAALFLSTSSTVSSRIISLLHESRQYYESSFNTRTTELGSIELRLEFIRGSLKIIRKNPWLGHGVGSFSTEYKKINGTLIPGTTELTEPHDTFLMILVQIGIVGFLLFLFFLISLFYDIRCLPFYYKCLGLALGLLFIFNSSVNATLLDSSGYVYVLIVSILLSSRLKKNINHGS